MIEILHRYAGSLLWVLVAMIGYRINRNMLGIALQDSEFIEANKMNGITKLITNEHISQEQNRCRKQIIVIIGGIVRLFLPDAGYAGDVSVVVVIILSLMISRNAWREEKMRKSVIAMYAAAKRGFSHVRSSDLNGTLREDK